MAKKSLGTKSVEVFTHEEATRKNIPTAEHESVMHEEQKSPIRVAYERRNRDLDPQLVWRGKDEQDWSDLVVQAPPLYIQEKVHPKVLIDDLRRQTEKTEKTADYEQIDLFADFNGLPDAGAKTEFYQHDQNWSNRMILGDSLQVMASLAEREGLRGQVQCIYIDPPYGIRFNSNFQWSTTDKTGTTSDSAEKISREPEQVKAFRDTWRDGIHSYLTYLRDRFTVARELLSSRGSIFVQIGDENVHLIRSLLDEVFGMDNFCALIPFRKKTMPMGTRLLEQMDDYLLWYARDVEEVKYNQLFVEKEHEGDLNWRWCELPSGERRPLTKAEITNHALLPKGVRLFRLKSLEPSGPMASGKFEFHWKGQDFPHPKNGWATGPDGMRRLAAVNKLQPSGTFLQYVLFNDDYPVSTLTNPWQDTSWSGFGDEKIYVVQTTTTIVRRCLLMATDPGDLVLDPTCGSGTTAYVAEQWGRRWITIDTSHVALALARARIMGARYPYYLLNDSLEGRQKEAELTRTVPSDLPTQGDIRHGFVYERVPHITLKSIANNAEIDVIWEKFEAELSAIRNKLAVAIGKNPELEIPREAHDEWTSEAIRFHTEFWKQRIGLQRDLDASIKAKGESEYLFDKPFENKSFVRVAGPFTVESLSPHRVLGVDENDELIDPMKDPRRGEEKDFVSMILENLHTAGVQQAHKDDKIDFSSLTPWPGEMVCAEGRYEESGTERRAAIFVGPEFGTVSRPDLVQAAREAGDAGFDVLISCAFNYDALSSEFDKLGRIPVLKARMNADLHMAEDLKNTGKGNLFVIFGEPDIDILDAPNGQIQVKVNGVDVFHPNTGEVRSDGADGIACWFIDTDYNEESFFVRQAYFLGANDPYKSLKTTLKAEINEEAWATLHSDTSRPFDKPDSGRIAVKVINHLGDEVMKVFRT